MIITVGAEKGGVAKTRLSTNLAAFAASQGIDVVLLDTDKQGSAISWARIRSENNVEPSFPVLPLPPHPAREIASLSTKYSLVIVDIGAQNYRTMQECSLLSDLVLVPCGADQQEVESTLTVFEHIREIDHKHATGRIPAHVVLTRVSTAERSKTVFEVREFFDSEGVPVFSASIPTRAAWVASGKTGRAVHELKGKDFSAKAAEELAGLFKEIEKLAS